MGEIKFNNLGNNYGIYQKGDEDAKKPVADEEKSPEKQTVMQENKSVSPDKALDALNFMGLQNLAHVKVKNENEIIPEEHLTPETISSIETMMIEDFEKGVEKYAQSVRAEFGSVLSEEAILALAANAFASAS